MALTLVGCDETHLSRASLIVVCLFLFVPAICWSQPATDRALRQSAARGAKDGSSWFGLTVAWAQINLEGTGQWTSVVRSSLRMDLRRKSTSAEVTLELGEQEWRRVLGRLLFGRMIYLGVGAGAIKLGDSYFSVFDISGGFRKQLLPNIGIRGEAGLGLVQEDPDNENGIFDLPRPMGSFALGVELGLM